MAKKNQKSGIFYVDLASVAYESFSDMSYFNKWIPEGCKLVKVQICQELGAYDETAQVFFAIEWKLEE